MGRGGGNEVEKGRRRGLQSKNKNKNKKTKTNRIPDGNPSFNWPDSLTTELHISSCGEVGHILDSYVHM